MKTKDRTTPQLPGGVVFRSHPQPELRGEGTQQSERNGSLKKSLRMLAVADASPPWRPLFYSQTIRRPALDDIMGPDGYRTGLLFHAGMPELRDDPRFVPLCARLGLVEFWLATGKWPDCVDDVPYDFKAECGKVRAVPIDEFGF